MKIAFDYQIFSLQSYGGISRYFVRLAKYLLSENQEIKIFSPLHRNNYLEDIPRTSVSGNYLSFYPSKTGPLIKIYNEIVSGIEMTRWKPSVVHETYYSKARYFQIDKPKVITVYDMIHELFGDEFGKINEVAQIKRSAIDRADRVICISENTKSDLIRLLGTPENKISVVHLGFDHFDNQHYSRTGAKDHNNKPFLLYVGKRDGYKNFAALLRAVGSSKKLKKDFEIIAFGGGCFTQDEIAMIHSLGFSEFQVRQIGGNDDMLGHLYLCAKAFIYPSLYEGFGIPPLEAMAHNCPVISSNTSSMPEVIGEAGKYFNPEDVDDMRSAIEEVVYSEDEIDFLKRAGTLRLKNYSWDKCAKETLQIYRSLI